MTQFDLQALSTSAELPSSDDTPVDNVGRRTWRSQDQNFLPNFLLFLLQSIWRKRNDWFFGVDMGVYHTTGATPRVPVVPDGFLSLGVQRRKDGRSRPSYVVWEENGVVPILTLEMVSHTPGGEYSTKVQTYKQLGVLYYVVYNPDFWQRDGHQPFELYKLVNDAYQLQTGEPYWMPEVGLGIGRFQRPVSGIPLELLYWYDRQGNRYLAADEREEQEQQRAEAERQRAEAERQRAEAERQRAERLAARLRALGEDPDR